MISDYSGYWTGTIEGTNQGGLAFDLKQHGSKVSGKAQLREASLGEYEYVIEGQAGKNLSAKLIPGYQSGGINLGIVQVVGSIVADGKMTGRWTSSIGTGGVFVASRFNAEALSVELPKSNSVFLVHGHDEGAKHSVARFLEQLGITPVILQEQINAGKTVIEKFEEFANRAGFAVILMTPDDEGYPIGNPSDAKKRPRQNVVLELGYFAAKLGRDKTLVLVKGDVELPSDVFGLVFEELNRSDGWKMRLAKELKAAGFSIDLNKAI